MNYIQLYIHICRTMYGGPLTLYWVLVYGVMIRLVVGVTSERL